MSVSLIERTPSAYDYPLLIKHLLYTPLATAPEQEIVYRDISRYTYRTLRQRIGRLASGLAGLGVKPGDTVAVMDWDSHRYLECYFAIPMMGAVLEMINIRLSPEQILYTLNHAGAAPNPTMNRGSTIFLTLMKTRAPPPSIPPVPPATRKASILAIGNWCCIPWPCLGHWPAPLSTSASIVATSICPLRRCSMCMRGGLPMWQQPWARSRSTRAATCRMPC